MIAVVPTDKSCSAVHLGSVAAAFGGNRQSGIHRVRGSKPPEDGIGSKTIHFA